MMSPENARRIAERQERERLKISEADVEAYERVHYPEHFTPERLARVEGIAKIPGNRYVAGLSHERFHEWFGTECDDTCPHPRPPPGARLVRRSWWRRLLGM